MKFLGLLLLVVTFVSAAPVEDDNPLAPRGKEGV
jgi:hypothetical protein